MSKEFDILVFIGRFQPLHLGHEKIIDEAMKRCEKLIVLVGSSNRSRSIQNPFTYSERADMITRSRQWSANQGQLVVQPLNDYLYNDPAWVSNVQKIIEKHRKTSTARIGLVGFSKDNSSYYLKMFPQWGSINIPTQHSTFNSTDIRKAYFQSMPILPYSACSKSVVEILGEYMWSSYFSDTTAEANDIAHYKNSWSMSPFPPTFVTVDNVVIQSGHILLIKRGEFPGKGQLALPGGFLDVDETLEESALRELKEETEIQDYRGEIPKGVLKSFITNQATFDDPRRSTRGRTVTEAFLYELPPKEELYQVKGSDDAAHAAWYPIGTVPANQFFEDHYFIMCKMLGLTME